LLIALFLDIIFLFEVSIQIPLLLFSALFSDIVLSVVRKVKSIIFAGWVIIVYAKQKHPA